MAFKKFNEDSFDQNDYVYNWIRNLISSDTVNKYESFMSFIEGFEDRYTSSQKSIMQFAWNVRTQIIKGRYLR